MATVGELVVKVRADTTNLRRNLKQAEASAKKSAGVMARAFAKMRTAIGAVAKSIFSMRGALVAVAGAAALGLVVKRSLEAADTIAKTADIIGISTDALQEYRFAAGLAGVETATLDNSFKKFTKNVGELGKSSSELDTTLRDLAPTMLENLRAARNMDEALAAFFKGLSNVEGAAKKVAVAQAAMGRAGSVMVNIVREGNQALLDFMQQARDLGLVIQESLVRDAEKAIDQLSILEQVIRTKVTVAVVENAAEIANAAEAMTSFVIGSINLLSKLASAWEKTGNKISEISRNFLLSPEQRAIFNQAQQLIEGGNAPFPVGPGGLRIGIPKPDVPPIMRVPRIVPKGFDNKTLFDIKKAIEDARKESEKAKGALEQYADSVSDLNAGLQNVAVGGLRSMEDALLGIVSGTVKAKDAFKTMAFSIVQDLQRILIQKAITGPIAGALGNFFGGAPAAAVAPALVPSGVSSGGGTIFQSFDLRGAAPGTASISARDRNMIKQETLAALADQTNQGGAMARATGRRR